MNAKMIELANKANKEAGYIFKLEDAKQMHELMEKFAELIVKECLETIEEMDPHSAMRDIDNIYVAVEKHFGVEE